MASSCGNTEELVCELCRHFYGLGWVTGTGGSIAIRNEDLLYMTPSGVQKERIKPEEIFRLNLKGDVVHCPNATPSFTPKLSDCSPLFLHAFQQRTAGAVLHSHGKVTNLITAMFDGKSEFRLSHQEMIKGIKGFGYRDELVIPIIENTAHEHELADSLGAAIAAYPKACAVLVRRHGMYVWGDNWEQAKRHGECLHYLFEICIAMRTLNLDFTRPAVTVEPAYAGIVIPKASFNDVPLYADIRGSELELEYRKLVCELCRQFYTAGWVTGTGGSICIRHGEAIFMTPSGVQKERIQPDELYVLDRNGNILSTPAAKPTFTPKLSDCSPLFLHAFQQRNAGAVLHSHATCTNLITAMFDGKSEFRLSHQEMIKGIKGFGYRDELVIPIIENTAHEHELADSLGAAIAAYPKACAVLVRRHGMYVWGDNWEQAKRHGECLHYLFDICINMKTLRLDFTLPAVTATGTLDANAVVAAPKTTSTVLPKSEVYLFDIEGTTTPITFVKDILFPFASNRVHSFLESTWDSVDTRADVAALYEQARKDAVDTAIQLEIKKHGSPTDALIKGDKAAQIKWLVEYVQLSIRLDRKIGALKQLQGHIWKLGYQSGELKGDLFADIPATFERIIASGARIAIYSSGSREAQKQIFKYSAFGDLSKYISCYFDTFVGGKREKASYQQIILSLGVENPANIVFFTDVLEEAVAAKEAGLSAVVSIRPGNAPVATHTFPELKTFDQAISL